MARKPKEPVEESAETSADKKILAELRERYTKCVDADSTNRDKYRANMRFALIPGEQWDEATKKDRGKDRVMYEFNEIRIKGKAIVNQIRANRPAAKITPAEEGDIALAEAMKAQVDQIQNASDGDSIMDYAAHHQVFGGMGAERYITAWQEDSVDRQDIIIEPILNPMCLYPDYACQKQDKSDARFWILASNLPKDVYKEKFKNAKPVDFQFDDDFEDDCDEERVWVAEYWVQKPVMRELWLLSDGKTVDAATIKALPEGITIVKRRRAPGHKICQYICSGDAVLTEETYDEKGNKVTIKEHEWAGKEFPFNMVYGEYTVIDGKVFWYGITEHGKDAQRALNWAETSMYEAIASTPQSVTWVTAKQADGLVGEWAESQRKNIGVRRYNHDQNAPGPPQTTPPASIPTALVNAVQMARESLKSSLGMPDSTLGEQGAENSGVAIKRRQEAGAVANYNFGDNMVNFMRRRTEILIDLIPKVKDTPYTLRVLGKDGAEKYVKLNEIDPVTGNKLNDLSAMKYDLVVTQGPNFATQRQEAAETYMGLSQGNPALMAVAGDLIVGALDLPKAQEIAERLKATLPPAVQAMLNKDAPEDPRVVAAMQQVEQLQANLQEQAQLVDEETAKAVSDKAAAEKAKSDVVVQQAQLKVQEAELNTAVAQFKQLVAETEAQFAQLESKAATEKGAQDNEAERAQLGDQLTEALAAIQEQATGLFSQYATQLAQFQQQGLEQVAAHITQPKRPKVARTKRVNGELVTTVMDAETGEPLQRANTQRVNGELVTTVQ